ncbi:MAG: hypothetical protein ACRDWY_06565 [Actinomycetes bacterium]
MEAGDSRGVVVRPAPDVVTRRPVVVTDALVVTPGADPERAAMAASRRPLAMSLVGALLLALASTLGLALWAGGDDDVVVKVPAAAGGKAPGVAPLAMTVEPPASVMAGEEVPFTVRWSDGSGVFSGSSEEWGDGVGASSLAQERCGTGRSTTGASDGSYRVRHEWTEPGSYPVVIGLVTYTCEGGTAREEAVSRTLTVRVLPAG